MTKEELAEMLDGRDYDDETTGNDEDLAQAAGLVIVYGASDDLMEIRGAITDEMGCFGGRTFLVGTRRIFPMERNDSWADEEMAEYLAAKRTGRTLRAIWGEGGYDWTYETEIPHATFVIREDGESYCRGIVFELPLPREEK